MSTYPAMAPLRERSFFGSVVYVPKQKPTHEADLDPDSLGSVIRHARKGKGFSQAELGYLVGLTQSQVSQLERGATAMPHLDTLRAIAHHTGVEPGYLLELARWPGAFKRGIPAELADVFRDLDELQTEAVVAFARIVAGDDVDEHGLSDADVTRIRNYAHHIMQRVQRGRE